MFTHFPPWNFFLMAEILTNGTAVYMLQMLRFCEFFKFFLILF